MERTLFVVCLVIAVFVGFQLGYSLSPFFQAGVIGDRREKGVESKIDDAMKRHFEELYRDDRPAKGGP